MNHTKQKSWPQRLLALLAAVVLCAALPAAGFLPHGQFPGYCSRNQSPTPAIPYLVNGLNILYHIFLDHGSPLCKESKEHATPVRGHYIIPGSVFQPISGSVSVFQCVL